MGPCNCSPATNSAVEVPVVSPITADTISKRSLDNVENEGIRIQKKARESIMDNNNVVDEAIAVATSNEEEDEEHPYLSLYNSLLLKGYAAAAAAVIKTIGGGVPSDRMNNSNEMMYTRAIDIDNNDPDYTIQKNGVAKNNGDDEENEQDEDEDEDEDKDEDDGDEIECAVDAQPVAGTSQLSLSMSFDNNDDDNNDDNNDNDDDNNDNNDNNNDNNDNNDNIDNIDNNDNNNEGLDMVGHKNDSVDEVVANAGVFRSTRSSSSTPAGTFEASINESRCNPENIQQQGLEWWDPHYKDIKGIEYLNLINCVASKTAYRKMKKRINEGKGFGGDNSVFPLYVPRKKNYVLMSRFRYRIQDNMLPDEANTGGYYEGRAEISGILFTFTVKKQDLINLDNFDISVLHASKNTWIRITGGDKKSSAVISNAPVVDPTRINKFTHLGIVTENCVFLSVVSGLLALGFDESAMQFFQQNHATLHQQTAGLWDLIASKARQYVPQLKLRRIVTPGGINGSQVMEMNDDWAIILQILTNMGGMSHWICICGGMIYDSNSTIILPKSMNNLDVCARLHGIGSKETFSSTKMVYRLIPHNMNCEGGNPSWNTLLPKREGWEYYEKRKCTICDMNKKRKEYSNRQWKNAYNKRGTCAECVNIK